MMRLEQIKESLRKGNSGETRKNVIVALEEGHTHQAILGSMLDEMAVVGRKFKLNELFVPEVLIIGRAFNMALEVIKPLIEVEDPRNGVVVIGTVRGDLHDIGKNLVKMLMGGTGVKVIDLGVDVTAERFVMAIREHKPDMLAMSALLTTTMVQMKDTIKMLEKEGLRQDVKVIVGGAPVTESYAKKVGADFYAFDAGGAAEIVKAFFEEKHIHNSLERQ